MTDKFSNAQNKTRLGTERALSQNDPRVEEKRFNLALNEANLAS